jgi:hypothetical protein
MAEAKPKQCRDFYCLGVQWDAKGNRVKVSIDYERVTDAILERRYECSELDAPHPRCHHMSDKNPCAEIELGTHEIPREAVAQERERCAQACENMIVHPQTWDPDRKLTPAEALTEAARRIRAGEFGALDWTGWRPE